LSGCTALTGNISKKPVKHMGVGLGRAYVGRSFRPSPSGDIHTSNMYHCMTLSRSNNTTYMYKISYDGEADYDHARTASM